MKIDWTKLNFDPFLRRLDAPAMATDNITVKDMRYGGEFIFANSNLSPKIVKRNNMNIDALLQPLNFVMTDTVQITTGYDLAVNSYFYGVSWDGTNYYLRRFNAMDLINPFQDGFSVNIPTADAVYGVTISDDRVLVALKEHSSGENRLYYYNWDLSLDTYKTTSTSITGTMACDGEYIYWLDSANNYLRKYAVSDYSLVKSIAWPTATQPTPDKILAYDKTSFYAYDSSNTKVVKFVVNPDDSISIVFNEDMREDIKGIFNYKSYIYYCYQSSNGLIAVPEEI